MKRRWDRVLLTLATLGLAALATGCESGAPATPSPGTARGAPALAFDKLQVDLGTVARNQEGIQTFLLMNRGGAPLAVGPVTISVEEGCDATETVEGNAELQPGEVFLLPISLGPHRQLGPHHLLVKVPSNDPATSVASLSVRFVVAEDEAPRGTGPRLRVDKEFIDIGTVPNDWPMYERFTLRNGGDSPLILEEVPLVRVEEGC